MKKLVSALMAMLLAASMVIVAGAAASDFKPSVEQKELPDIVEQEFQGQGFDAILLDEAGLAIKGLTVGTESGEVILTPWAKKDVADPSVDRELFEEGHESIVNANNLQELNPEIKDNMVVNDFFYISYKGTLVQQVEDGYVVVIRMKENVPANAEVQFIMYVNGVWSLLDASNNGDGTFTVKFTKAGPVAVLVSKDAVSGNKGESPKTSGVNMTPIYVAAGVIGVAAVAGGVVLFRRKKIAE